MASTAFDNIVHFGRETVKQTFQFIGEEETPTLDYFMSKRKKTLTEQGMRIPLRTRKPGGHTSFDRSNVDFREPVSLEGDSMYTYPIWYALPFKIDGSTLRDLKRGDVNQFMNYKDYMTAVTKAAKKRLNIYCHGDQSAVLGKLDAAFAASTSTTLSLATSASGEGGTKGGVRLEQGHRYAVLDASTQAINFGFEVDTANRLDPTVDATSAGSGITWSAAGATGDLVVDQGPISTVTAYNKAMNGLRGLIKNSGVIQNMSLTDHPDLKSQAVNGNSLPVSPFNFDNAKTLVRIAANDMGEAEGRVTVMTPGQDSVLRAQQYGYRRYDGNETVRGVAKKFVDADGDIYLFDADAAEDRIYLFDGGSFYFGEEKPFGMYNEDSQEIRMLHGANNAGSDSFFGAIGWGGNLIKDGLPRRDAYIYDLSLTDVNTQSSL